MTTDSLTPDDAPPASPAPDANPAPAKGQTDWMAEVRGILWLILAVLGFHSLIAKPFYIPSDSMLPGLLVGDRLVVTKYPYGWSYVSPSFHVLPFIKGRLFGRLPERGDVVIIKPPTQSSDYIKRVIGLPGDTIEVRHGQLILNGVAVKRVDMGERRIAVDANQTCNDLEFPGRLVRGGDGKDYCQLPIVRETLPSGRSYDTIDLGYFYQVDDYGPIKVPADHLFLMGDNRDRSADSRVPIEEGGFGGPLPLENLGGRAEFITFSLNGNEHWWNPISWFQALRSGRSGTSLHPTQGPAPGSTQGTPAS